MTSELQARESGAALEEQEESAVTSWALVASTRDCSERTRREGGSNVTSQALEGLVWQAGMWGASSGPGGGQGAGHH